MNVCIPKETAKRISEAIKGKELDISQLWEIKDADARIKFLEKYAGEDAKIINQLFEQKIVLKNQVAGAENFLAKITAKGRYAADKIAETKKVIADFKAQQLQRILDPKEGEIILGESIKSLLGEGATVAQAREVGKLYKALEIFKEGFDMTTKKWASERTADDFAGTQVNLLNYIEKLKTGNLTLKQMLAERVSAFKDTYAVNKTKAVGELLMESIKFITNNSISMVASFDNSFMGRQGLKTLMINPKLWWEKDVKNSFKDIYTDLKGGNARDALLHDLFKNPKYLTGEYELSGILKSKMIEEQYPSDTIGSKIPILKNFFTASENAFVGSALRSRTALYDWFSDKAIKKGVDMTDPYQIKSIGKMVSSLTARGQWGKTGEPALVRIFMWAPKMLKANLDVLTGHLGQDISPFARKQAAVNLLKIVGTTATVMMVANAMKPGSAELDPRSTDFGKIKIGNTRFDITGGASSLVVLASRLITNSSKSSTSGNVSEFGTGYGQANRLDLLYGFLEGKTTPPARMVMDLLKGQTIKGVKPTVPGAIYSMFTPILIQNVIELKDDSSTQAVLGAILDGIGINANTYSTTTDWTMNPGVELSAFQAKVGDAIFKEANKKYDAEFATWYSNVKLNPTFQALSQDQKQQVVSNKKSSLKTKIMSEFGFKYQRAKSVPLPKL